jgi:hypothetical protein
MEDSKLKEMVKLHQERNRQSAQMFEEFSMHREMISGVIQQCLTALPPVPNQEPGNGRKLPTLTVWGAGNTNDLDLPAICARFEMVQLIDLDLESLERAKQRADLSDADRAKLRLVGNCDSTGLLPQLASLAEVSGDSAGDRTATFIADTDKARPRTLSGDETEILKTDVVISACMLSQLIDSVFKTLGDDFERVNDVVLAVRDNHLRMLLDAVEVGSVVALVTDFVSSDTLPALKNDMSAQEFLDLVVEAINAKNFFTGTNPAALQQRLTALQDDRQGFAGAAQGKLKVTLTQPWRWKFGERSFAAIALVFR